MGKARKHALRLDFDRKLKLEFHGTKVTSDAGLLTYRELEEVLRLTTMIESELTKVSEAVASLYAQGQVHQDRSQGGQAFQIHHLPDGRSGRAEGGQRRR